MTVNTKMKFQMKSTDSSSLDLGHVLLTHDVDYDDTYVNGTATSQVDGVWSDERTVSVGTETLNLDALVQTDSAAGTVKTLDFAVVKGIIIKNTSAADYLEIFGTVATNFYGPDNYPVKGSDDVVNVPAGGVFVWIDPIGGSTTGKEDILVTAVTSDQTYEIQIIGELA